MGPLALAVAERAKRRRRVLPESHDWKSGIAADLRHAVRAIRLNRSFSAIVVLTLAIGIGACTAVFSIVNALLLRIAAVSESRAADARVGDRRRQSRATDSSSRSRSTKTGRRKRAAFQSMGIWEYRTYNVASAQEPEQVQGIRATVEPVHDARRVAGARPRLHGGGRGAGPSRRRDQRRRVAKSFWRRRRRRSARRFD